MEIVVFVSGRNKGLGKTVCLTEGQFELCTYELKMRLVSMVECFLYVNLAAHFQMWERWRIIFNYFNYF